MLNLAKELLGQSVYASDGPVGTLTDIYFDDLTWNVRYFVVDVGTFFHRRKVLLSPQAVADADFLNRTLTLKHSVDEIKKSPDIDVDKPVYRQLEEQLLNYYGWVAHWVPQHDMPEPQPQPEPNADTDLRSMNNICKYIVMAFDGRIGSIVDFVLDKDTWHIPRVVLDTSHYLPDAHATIPTKRVKAIRCGDEEISIDMYKTDVMNESTLDLAHV